jgi:hypothetical protein
MGRFLYELEKAVQSRYCQEGSHSCTTGGRKGTSKMKEWVFVLVVGAGMLAACSSSVSAASLPLSVVCPGTAMTTDREFALVANSEAVPLGDATLSCFATGTGNLNDDEFGTAWVLLDKDQPGDTVGICETCLTVTGLGSTSGTFSISVLSWATYNSLLLGFKTGEGQLGPDWAVFRLGGGITGGTWSVSGQQSLSHADLFAGGGGQTLQEVPEPATLVLFGTGLFGAARTARKRRNKK